MLLDTCQILHPPDTPLFLVHPTQNDPRTIPGAPQEHPKESRSTAGSPQAYPKSIPGARSIAGAPQEHPRSLPGAPAGHPGAPRAPGTPQEYPSPPQTAPKHHRSCQDTPGRPRQPWRPRWPQATTRASQGHPRPPRATRPQRRCRYTASIRIVHKTRAQFTNRVYPDLMLF